MADINFTQDQIDAVSASLASCRSMVEYYVAGVKKAQNAAMVAAGLPPLHDALLVKWDEEHLAKYQSQVTGLESLLALMQPETCAEAAQ